ncbi:DsbA family protein [Garicola koreensis]|uniref:Protein-disulfide isomerase n=1 Tax=Garicola koreensis TaxID=1262554 RepID=A0A7W5XNT0_9MICC|nr:DsbA family protein [Garicola koreensis]MBB3667087.1 protein-disulfide isomerase [Garicola koreensis]
MSDKPALTGRSWLIPVLVLAAAAVVIAVLLWPDDDAQQSRAGQGPDQQSQSAEEDVPADVVNPDEYEDPDQTDFSYVEARDEQDPLAAGDVDAPVGLVVFSDYQCPFCASWSHETLPAMMDYVEAGDLRIEWRDLNVFGPASEAASQAAYAAGLQGEFWQYHDELFVEGETRSESALSDEALTELAGELGLDVEQFSQDMHSDQVIEEIEANQQMGFDLGAHSTPVFVLDGEPVVGAQPTEVFTDAVDEALEASQE